MPKPVRSVALIIGTLVLGGCSLLSLTPQPGDPLVPRPIVVATPTPAGARLHVSRAYTQPSVALPTASTPLSSPLALKLDVRPAGVFILVLTEVHNSAPTALPLAQLDLTLQDGAGQTYLRADEGELILALLDTPLLSDRPLPSGARAVGLLVFDAPARYANPLRLVARLPGEPPLASAPFIPGEAP
jgi:hypothetical protein